MRWYKLLSVIFIIAFAEAGVSQDIYNEILNLSIKNHRDSAFAMVDRYEKHFHNSEHWDSLSKLYVTKGELLIRSDGYEAALEFYEKAEKLLSDHYDKKNPFYLYYLYCYSKLQLDLGEINEAEKNIKFLTETALENNHYLLYKNGFVNNVILQIYKNNYLRGDSLLNAILPEIETAPIDTFNLIRTYSIKRYLDSYYHRTESAFEIAKKNLPIIKAKFGSHHPNTAVIYSELGNTYGEVGNVKKAFEYLHKSKDILYREYQNTGNSYFLATVLQSIGLIYKKIGEYELAIDHLLYGLELTLENTSDKNINLMWDYHAITESYIGANQFRLARRYNNKSRRLINSSPEGNEYQKFFVQGYEAEILHYEGYHLESLRKAEEVYNYLISIEDDITKDQISTMNLLCLNYLSLKEAEKALKWGRKQFNAALDYYGIHHSETLLPLLNILAARLQLQDEGAIYSIRDTILQLWNIDNSALNFKNCAPDKWLLTYAEMWAQYLGENIQTDKKKRKEYFTFLNEFEEYYQRHLSIIRSNSRITENTKTLKSIYKAALEYYAETYPLKFMLTAEKIKSFKTKMLLQSQLIQDQNSKSPENTIRQHLMTENDTAKMNAMLEMGQALEKYAAYKDSLQQYDPILYEKKYGLNHITAERLSEILDKNEMLLEFLKIDSTLYLLSFDGSQAVSHKMNYRKVMSEVEKHFSDRNTTSAQILYKKLIPEEAYEYEKLLIIPDDKLNYLNFEELISEDGRFLIESKRIRYAYSGSVLSYQNEIASETTNKHNILSITPGFSDRLKNNQLKRLISDTTWQYLLRQPFLLQLSDQIGNFSKSVSMTDSIASEYFFKENAEHYKVLHLGTHGILNDASPLFSKLIFTRDKNEDGFLHTYEIYGEDLKSDLAVLSACNTGAGKLVSGEGVVSLAYAFTHAGCPATLMTLWEVDEKTTAAIAEKFYSYLMKGERKSEALRKAKIDYLNSAPQQMRAPYYWAGLTLMGSDNAVFKSHWYENNWYLIASFLIIAFFISVVVLNRRKKI